MSRRAWSYIACIILLGATTIALVSYYAQHPPLDWLAFVVLLIMAIPAQLYRAPHGRHTYYPHFICFVAGVLMLPPQIFSVLVIAPHVVEWIDERWKRGEYLRNWYIQPFNIATHLISGAAGYTLVSAAHGGITPVTALPPIVVFITAAFLYILINHFVVGGVLFFARGLSFTDSQIMSPNSLLPDFILASMGILVAVLWTIDPWWIVLALLPLVLMYQALQLPQLKEEAQTDSKTGLFNARHFTKRATAALAAAKRSSTPISLIMADLDYLRTINNTYGHLAGDVVIAGIGKIIREMIHDEDIAARFGGEEFTIALPETDLAGATTLGERLRSMIEQTGFVIASGETLHATISIGIACLAQGDGTLEDLTHAADIAVYYAKFLGRNRVICAPDVPCAARLEYQRSQSGDSSAAAPQAAPSAAAGAESVGVAAQPGNGAAQPIPSAHSTPQVASPGLAPAPPTVVVPKPKAARSAPVPNVPSPAIPRRFLSGYVGLTILLGLGIVLAGVWFSPPIDLRLIALFAVLAVLAELFQINLYGDNTTSVSVSVAFAAALMGGVVGVAIVSVAIVAVHTVKKRPALYKTAFNWAIHVLAGVLPALIMYWLAAPPRFESIAWLAGPLIVAAMGYYVIETGLVVVAISITSGARPWTLWNDQFRWLAMHYLTLCLIGAFTVMAVSSIGLWGLLICALPLFVARYAQAQYIQRTETSTAELRRMNGELRQANEAILEANEAISALNADLNDFNEQLFETLARFCDARDPYVGGHAAKVAEYAVAIAHELGLDPARRKIVRQAGYLHDIGKIALPERILHKPGPLTDEEYAVVKTHVTIGANLLELSSGLRPLVPFILHHHERWDGRGYPSGLRETDIPLEARILNLCDSVEAMASDRPYHRGMTAQEVIVEVERCSGTQFDPEVVAAFFRVIDRIGEAFLVNSAHLVGCSHELTGS